MDLQLMEDFLMGTKPPKPDVWSLPAHNQMSTQAHQSTFVALQNHPPGSQKFPVPHSQAPAAATFAPVHTQPPALVTPLQAPPTFPQSHRQPRTFLSPQVQAQLTQPIPTGGAQQAPTIWRASQTQVLPIAPPAFQALPFAIPAGNTSVSARQVAPSASTAQPRPTSHDQKTNVYAKARQAKILAIIDSLRPQMLGKSRDECISILQTKFKTEQKMAAVLYDRYYATNKAFPLCSSVPTNPIRPTSSWPVRVLPAEPFSSSGVSGTNVNLASNQPPGLSTFPFVAPSESAKREAKRLATLDRLTPQLAAAPFSRSFPLPLALPRAQTFSTDKKRKCSNNATGGPRKLECRKT